MKLDYWSNKFFTSELNAKHMSEVHKWPRLNSILEATDRDIPAVSRSKVGEGIYLGWANIGPDGKSRTWFYHHSLCRPQIEASSNRNFGFTLSSSEKLCLQIASSKDRVLCPVFNIGKLPESDIFVKILRENGILARTNMPVLSAVELIKK